MSGIKSKIEGVNVSEFDIYTIKAVMNEIQLRGFDIEAVREPVANMGYTVRALSRKGDLTGIGSASSSQSEKLMECVSNAKFLSTLNMQPIKYEFPQSKPVQNVEIVDNSIRDDPVESIRIFTESMIDYLKDQNSREISLKPTFGKIRTYYIETTIENSAGLFVTKNETLFFVELALKVSDGIKLAEFWPRKYRRRIADLKVDELMPKWTKLAKDTISAKMAPTGTMSVIMNPESVCDAIVPVVGFHSSADQKFKNQSVFNKGERIASEKITIVDDGLANYGLCSASFDDEGNPQKKTILLEKGIFRNFISDQKYSMLIEEQPTGNGIKPLGMLYNPLSKHLASIGTHPTNICISPGNENLDDLIEDTSDGIFIEQFSWLSPDPFSSGFSSEIRNGYLIKNGELTQPIKGGMVSGKVFDLINNVSDLSKYAEIESGSTAFTVISPYIKFHNVQVVGK